MSGTITGTRAGTTSKRVCCSEHEGRKAGEHETGRLECVWTGTVSLRALSCHGIQAKKITDSMSCVSFYQGDGVPGTINQLATNYDSGKAAYSITH